MLNFDIVDFLISVDNICPVLQGEGTRQGQVVGRDGQVTLVDDGFLMLSNNKIQ